MKNQLGPKFILEENENMYTAKTKEFCMQNFTSKEENDDKNRMEI